MKQMLTQVAVGRLLRLDSKAFEEVIVKYGHDESYNGINIRGDDNEIVVGCKEPGIYAWHYSEPGLWCFKARPQEDFHRIVARIKARKNYTPPQTFVQDMVSL